MFDVSTIHKEDDGFHAVDGDTDIVIEPLFPSDIWDSPEAFESAGIKGYEPMTAKELSNEPEQDQKFNSNTCYIEEKFDGTRALVYFLSQPSEDGGDVGFCRVFSRRVSKETNFYVENTDRLPHIREIDVPDLGGTIIDGEMFIDGRPFKDVASTLNCLWDKSIERQIEKGFISFHAFDILFYRGIDLRRFPLHRRKFFLNIVIEEANSPYIKEVPYHLCGVHSSFDFAYNELLNTVGQDNIDQCATELKENKDMYPTLWSCYENNLHLTPKAYYEMIVFTGGEGVMIKPIDGKYYHKRGWEYSKIKKFLTRELIVLGFDSPTKEYTGKSLKTWGYWIEKSTNKRLIGNFYGDKNYEPVTKFYFFNQVGNLLLGVLIPYDDYEKIPEKKRGAVYDPESCGLGSYDTNYVLMQVCECAGFDDDTRQHFTNNRDNMIGSVVEVKANEIFKDSGKLRHPRYVRRRFDKSAEECVWKDHIMS